MYFGWTLPVKDGTEREVYSFSVYVIDYVDSLDIVSWKRGIVCTYNIKTQIDILLWGSSGSHF